MTGPLRCPDCGHVGLNRPYWINHAPGCGLPAAVPMFDPPSPELGCTSSEVADVTFEIETYGPRDEDGDRPYILMTRTVEMSSVPRVGDRVRVAMLWHEEVSVVVWNLEEGGVRLLLGMGTDAMEQRWDNWSTMRERVGLGSGSGWKITASDADLL